MSLSNQPNHGAVSSEIKNRGSIFFTINHRKMNHVNLIGKISSQPRFYETPSGKRIAQFTLSTHETYLDEDGNTKSKKNWHRMSAWGRWVKVLQEAVDVGNEVAVEGKLTSRFYLKEGQKHVISEVEINDLIIL